MQVAEQRDPGLIQQGIRRSPSAIDMGVGGVVMNFRFIGRSSRSESNTKCLQTRAISQGRACIYCGVALGALSCLGHRVMAKELAHALHWDDLAQ